MKKRYVFIDIAKALGIILVVFNHCHIGDTVNFYYAIGRLGVPLLLFSSGYILFDKKINGIHDIIDFYKKYLLKFFICNFIWVIIWNIFNIIYFGAVINIKSLVLEIIAIKHTDNMWNSWFQMPMFGYYILLPIIKYFMDKLNRKQINILLILSIIYFYILPSFGINSIAGVELKHALYYIAPYFILYPLIGYLCKIKMTNVIYLIAILFYYLNNKLTFRAVTYADIWILLTGFICFRFICNIETCNFEKVFEYISKRTLSIFYIHMPLRHILGQYIVYIPIKNSHIQTIMLVIFDIIGSLLIIKILEIIPLKKLYKYLLFR